MGEEEDWFGNENPEFNDEKVNKRKKKRKKQLVKETAVVEEGEEEEEQLHKMSSEEGASRKSKKGKEESMKSKKDKKKHLLSEEGVLATHDDGLAVGKKDKKKKNKSLVKADEDEQEQEGIRPSAMEDENVQSHDDKADIRKIKRKRRLLKEAAEADKRGICYLSRIPPHMDPFKLRQILSQFGDIQRIYLAPENPVQPRRKRSGRFQEQGFSEGWVEFSDKRVAKRVADMLNGEQIGGKKRSSFYYDLWNIKYLSKFKWDDLTEEIAYKNAMKEQKLALEISAAKRERDFYLSKVDQARALSSIEERLKKKQKLQQESGTNADLPVSQQASKVVRKFPQKQPVLDNAAESKPRLSKDILAGVFGGS
ncbi:Splicing factor-like protein [Parasponia andersonii]|uniref:Splicing factor-like protein n=1 Tax=Parasponia andersonii TaxID=3476 RepID=A0A2P5CTG6_PARAD|nr:Splicing factor-like protein [Parasponia andersonii]